MLGCPVFNDII